MSIPTSFRDYLTLETVLVRAVQKDWARQSKVIFPPISDAIDRKDWDEAVRLIEAIDLSGIGETHRGMAYSVFRGCIELGSQLASGGRTLVSSLWFGDTVNRVVNQWLQGIEWSVTQQVQDDALHLVAQARDEAQLVQKAEPVRPFVSFRQSGDRLLQMVSGLHTNRLSSWGFIAESDMRGLTTYRLNAMLDNRTSEFCRFIHGKTFTIEDARGIIEQGVHADDPNALKEIHPWPLQTRAAMEEYAKLSNEELVARKLHVPPFHPYCRTMMVKEKSQPRVAKPPQSKEDAALLAEFIATQQTFADLGMKMDEKQVALWNDYVKAHPLDAMQMASGQSAKAILSGEVDAAIKINSLGIIKIMWSFLKEDTQFKNLVEFDPYAGLLYLSKQGIADSLTPEGIKYSQAYLSAAKQFGTAVAAEQLVMPVARGSAVSALNEGFIPVMTDWQSIRFKLMDRLEGPMKTKFDNLLPAKQVQLLNVLHSSYEGAMKKLTEIHLSKEFLTELLADTEYTGVYTL